MLRCSSVAERSLSPPSEKCLCSVVALSCKRTFGKCVERDTNAIAPRHTSTLAHAIHYRLHVYTCKRPHSHLDAYIWMHAYVHAFMNAIAVAIKRMQSHITYIDG